MVMSKTGFEQGFLGLDVGTTATKACVVTDKGRVAALQERSYPLHQSNHQRLELDPDEVISAICDVTSLVAKQCAENRIQIASLSFSILGEAFVTIDTLGSPIGRSPIAMDQRGLSKLAWFRERFGDQAIYERTGQPLHPMYTATKLAWWKDSNPATYATIHKILDWQSYLTKWMCGRAITDFSLAARTLLFDINSNSWWDDALAGLQLTPNHLPEVGEPGSLAGELLPDAARVLGLTPGLPIAIGAWDQACAALAGNLGDQVLMDSLGTTQALITVAPKTLDIKRLSTMGYQLTPGALKGTRIIVGGTLSGALILRWLYEKVADSNVRNYSELLNDIDVGPSELFVLPHLAGAGTPSPDPFSRAAIIGARFNTSLKDIIKASLDCLAYEARRNIHALTELGISIHHVHLTGGLTRYRSYVQRKADVYNLPVTPLKNHHGSAIGACLLAAQVVGSKGEVQINLNNQLRVEKKYVPNIVRAERHAKRYELYCRLQPLLQPVFQAMSPSRLVY